MKRIPDWSATTFADNTSLSHALVDPDEQVRARARCPRRVPECNIAPHILSESTG